MRFFSHSSWPRSSAPRGGRALRTQRHRSRRAVALPEHRVLPGLTAFCASCCSILDVSGQNQALSRPNHQHRPDPRRRATTHGRRRSRSLSRRPFFAVQAPLPPDSGRFYRLRSRSRNRIRASREQDRAAHLSAALLLTPRPARGRAVRRRTTCAWAARARGSTPWTRGSASLPSPRKSVVGCWDPRRARSR